MVSMMRSRLPALAPLAFVLASACATPSASGSASTQPEPETSASAAIECKPVDTQTPAEITSYEEGGIRIHSFVAPDSSSRTATHIVETETSLVLVDTQLLRDYAEQFRAYADGIGKPISHVIVSHGHPDHYFGLEYFEDRPSFALEATHEDIRQRQKFHLKSHREAEGECDAVTDRVRMPSEVLEPGEQEIGGVAFVFEQVRRAEDDDQLVVRVPAAKTLILQDLMATDAHAFTAAGMIDSWIETLSSYAGEGEYTHVLAGHGAPVGGEGLEDMIAYLERSKVILAEASDGEDFGARMTAEFPERPGLYLVHLMARIKF